MIPKNCSICLKGVQCVLPPSHLVSIKALGEEYLIGVTCNEHTQLVKKIIAKRINSDESVNIQAINLIATDCIINMQK